MNYYASLNVLQNALQRQAFSKRIIQAPIATGKETNTALSYEHPEIPNSSWFARQHDPVLFCLCL